MAIGGTVQHDLGRLAERLKLYPKELLAADVRAKNRAVSSTRTEAVRRLAPDLVGLKIGVIRGQLKLQRATPITQRASVDFSAKRFRLYGNWNARQTRRGVSISRMPWRIEAADGDVLPPQILAHAFIQRGRGSGTPNVFVRVGSKRYPIASIVASSVATAFRERGLASALIAFGRVRYRIALAQEMRFRLGRTGG